MPNAMPDHLFELFQHLRAQRFRELAGARVCATVPLSERLVNDLIATSLPPNGPVRSVAIRPEAEDRFSVRIVPRAALIPGLTLQLAVERQPQLPGSAVLTLRMLTLGGLFGLASGVIAGMFPPGLRLDGERIHVDLRTIAEQRGAGEALEYISGLRVHTEPGRVVLLVDAGVDAR